MQRKALATACALAVALALASCAGGAQSPESELARKTQGPQAPETKGPEPTSAPSLAGLVERPLAELSPDAVSYLESRSGSAGVAVVVPSRIAVYTWNGHQKFHMASVAKVGIMLTLMDQAFDRGRGLTDVEMSMLRPMITVSDNTTASRLWEQIGGGQATEDYFRSIGLNEIDPNKESCWGASYASAHDVVLLDDLKNRGVWIYRVVGDRPPAGRTLGPEKTEEILGRPLE